MIIKKNKFSLFFIVFFLLNLDVFSQSILDFDSEINYLFNSKQFVKAEIKLNDLKSKKKYEEYRFDIDYTIALCCLKINNEIKLKKAKSIFKRIIKNKRLKNSVHHNSSLFFYAEVLHKLNELDSALVYYEKFKRTNKNNIEYDLNIASCKFAIDTTNENKKYNLLKSNFNSFQDDFAACYLNENNSLLIFTSNRKRIKENNKINNYPKLNFYLTRFNDKKTKWSKPEILTFLESNIVMVSDPTFNFFNNKIYFSSLENINIRKDNKIGKYKIFSAIKNKDNWEKPKVVPLPYDNISDFKSPFITDDGNTLYFSSDIKGGYGGFDIWMIKKIGNNKWSLPINLGNKINTNKDELYPFKSSKNTLYFYK